MTEQELLDKRDDLMRHINELTDQLESMMDELDEVEEQLTEFGSYEEF